MKQKMMRDYLFRKKDANEKSAPHGALLSKLTYSADASSASFLLAKHSLQ